MPPTDPVPFDQRALRDPETVSQLLEYVNKLAGGLSAECGRPIRLMEVCGTHTMNIGRFGFRSALADGLELLSGPGCPVCVTASQDVDRAIALAAVPGVTVATFGDMVRVPGSTGSLATQRAAGADVRVVYSPLDAVRLAEELPDREVVLIGVGFETTAPAIAACALDAEARGLANFSILGLNKTTDAALRAIADDPAMEIDGFILPGHVCCITGLDTFGFLPREHDVPGVATGFEPVDILRGIALLLEIVRSGEPRIANAYPRCVRPAGNEAALALMDVAFERRDAAWRGLGTLPGSGLALKGAYRRLNALERFEVEVGDSTEPRGCRCGDVLRGAIAPETCPLFGRACTPSSPVGPCMVSGEGSCAAHYRYR